jgi:2-polyprenyl-3-methyl-5-hydroxy-6-metoxy-1,4-benzoquinol methylase
VRLDFGANPTIALPPRAVVHKTAADDPVDYYFAPLTARIYRARLRLAVSLLGKQTYASIVEVGFGSGIFLPELSRRAERVAGIDVHDQTVQVIDMLKELRISADLRQASLFEIPFADDEFDALVCLSVLEHITDLSAALDEFARVLRSGGIAVLGFPVRNVITDTFFRAVGYDPREIHPSSHRDISAAVRDHARFVVEREGRFPRSLPLDLAGYAACRCRATSPGRAADPLFNR